MLRFQAAFSESVWFWGQPLEVLAPLRYAPPSVKSPRLRQCPCQPHAIKTGSPLAELPPEHITPELLFLETKWAALVSYDGTPPRVSRR